MLLDKYTQANSSQIYLVQLDIEQIKYIIQSTFLDQIEMQANIYITYMMSANPILSLLIQAPEPSDPELQNPCLNIAIFHPTIQAKPPNKDSNPPKG